MEVWKPVKGYEGIYEISNYGNVKGIDRIITHKNGNTFNRKEKMLSTGYDRLGYLRVKLTDGKQRKNLYVHRLLAINFIDNPKHKKEVNHIDGFKANNSLDNLEWTTRSKNMKHAFKLGLLKTRRGVDNNKTKLTEAQVLKIRELHKLGKTTQTQLGIDYDVTVSAVNYIVNRKTWKHI